MEHNAESIIREKVKVAEQKKVAWDSRVVWDKVNSELRPKRKPVAFYYTVAASVLMIMAFAVYSLRSLQQQKHDEKVKSQELAGGDHKNSHTKSDIGKQEQPLANPVKEKSINRIAHRGRSKAQKEKANNEKVDVKLSISADTLPILQNEKEAALAESHIAAETKVKTKIIATYVEPVIGVIIPEKENIVVKKEKNVKIRMLKPVDQHDEKTSDDKTLVARIN